MSHSKLRNGNLNTADGRETPRAANRRTSYQPLSHNESDRAWSFTSRFRSVSSVPIYGNTAAITALFWEKGVSAGKPLDKKLWFSDTYVRTQAGWKYVFGQASRALPE